MKNIIMVINYFNNKLIAKQHYSTHYGGGGAGYGSCEKFIKKGDYKVPPEVQAILDKNTPNSKPK